MFNQMGKEGNLNRLLLFYFLLSRLKCETDNCLCVTTNHNVKKKEKKCKINHIRLENSVCGQRTS